MARVIIALLLLAGMTVPAMAGDRTALTGLRLNVTSGTLQLQKMTSSEAHLADDGLSVASKDLELFIKTGRQDRMVHVTAPSGRYFVQGRTIGKGEESPDQRHYRVQKFMRNPLENRSRGDIYMESPPGAEGQIKVTIGSQATLSATTLLWSEFLARFVCWGPFVQEVDTGQGSKFRVTGNVMLCNQSFDEFIYYGTGTERIVMEFTAPPAPKTGSKPSGRK